PSQRGEGPEGAGEPGVEDVLVAKQRHSRRSGLWIFSISDFAYPANSLVALPVERDIEQIDLRLLQTLALVVGDCEPRHLVLILGHKDLAIRPIPCRDPVPPPQLAADAP